jgi:hypothetical protein
VRTRFRSCAGVSLSRPKGEAREKGKIGEKIAREKPVKCDFNSLSIASANSRLNLVTRLRRRCIGADVFDVYPSQRRVWMRALWPRQNHIVVTWPLSQSDLSTAAQKSNTFCSRPRQLNKH